MSPMAPIPSTALRERRNELVAALKRFHVVRAGIFGSTAHGEDAEVIFRQAAETGVGTMILRDTVPL